MGYGSGLRAETTAISTTTCHHRVLKCSKSMKEKSGAAYVPDCQPGTFMRTDSQADTFMCQAVVSNT